ncbi:MAG: hypothetical protein H6742_07130 [Alphaproteobacteria bacterium]|nr:hypothetical protein [Alphaproteobacteria bacterium]
MNALPSVADLRESCLWARSESHVLAAVPELLGAMPSTVRPDPQSRVEILAPCTAALLAPTVRHTVAALTAAMEGRAADGTEDAELVPLLAQLAVEGSQGGLHAAAVPGLTMLAIARAAVQGGRFVMAALPEDLGRAVSGIRARIDGLPEGQAGAAMLAVSRTLAHTLHAACELAARLGVPTSQAGLAASFLDDGLLLSLRRDQFSDERPVIRVIAASGLQLQYFRAAQVVEDPSRPPSADPIELDLAGRLRRWDVGSALLDRLVLLTPGQDGWLGPRGLLGHAARDTFLVPRGDASRSAVVVATRLDALARAAGGETGGTCSSTGRVRVLHAWRELTVDAPGALHCLGGGLGLSAFTGPMEALEFAERVSRTLSGPRMIDPGDLAEPVSLGPDVRVSVGVAAGPLWGGTDGVDVFLDGPVVARAVTLAASPIVGQDDLSDVRRVGSTPDGGGGVRCDAEVWTASLTAAGRQGRNAVRCDTAEVAAFEVLPVRGWWDSRGRRMVLLGLPGSDSRGPAELVAMDPAQVTALQERDRALRAQVLEAAARPTDRTPVRDRLRDVDPLAAGALIGDLGFAAADAVDELEPIDDDETALTQAPGGDGDGRAHAPAWDATGFSLPEYSQELSEEYRAAELQLDAEDTGGYLVEVDDDYGFEEVEAEADSNDVFAASGDRSGPDGQWLHEETLLFDEPAADASALDLDAFDVGPVADEAALHSLHDGPPPSTGFARPEDESDAEPGPPAHAPLPRTPARPVALPERRTAPSIDGVELSSLFEGYVVVRDDEGGFIFGLRDGDQIRDAHSYETGADPDAAYRAFVQAKVAEGFVPQLELWSPLPAGHEPANLDHDLLQRAYLAMITS